MDAKKLMKDDPRLSVGDVGDVGVGSDVSWVLLLVSATVEPLS